MYNVPIRAFTVSLAAEFILSPSSTTKTTSPAVTVIALAVGITVRTVPVQISLDVHAESNSDELEDELYPE